MAGSFIGLCHYPKITGLGYAAAFSDLATRYRTPLIPFFLDGVAGVDALAQPDGLHPTSEGYRVIVDRIWPILRPLLARP